jgi:hypothetical protein
MDFRGFTPIKQKLGKTSDREICDDGLKLGGRRNYEKLSSVKFCEDLRLGYAAVSSNGWPWMSHDR